MYGGTGARANPDDGIPVIGKTGTAEKSHTMLAESSTKVTTVVWVGNIDGRETLDHFRNGYGTRLGDIRYGLAKAIQAAANSAYGGDAFPRPDDKLTETLMADIPIVIGKSMEEATTILEESGLSVDVGDPVDSDLPTGSVAAQSATGRATTGTAITLSPSNGQGATVPAAVIGQSRPDAQETLFGIGFSSVAFDSSCNPPNAKVTNTVPAAGTSANRRATIQLSC